MLIYMKIDLHIYYVYYYIINIIINTIMNPYLLESLDNSISSNCSIKKFESKIVLVFDTETSGLFPKSNSENLEEYPYILQLSFVLYDIKNQKIIHKFNKYIKIPENVEISPFITNLTGITHEMCNEGISIISALQHFYRAYKLCDSIVSHNISFDRQMIELEIIRNYTILSQSIPMSAFIFNSLFQRLENKQQFCTMAIGKNICNLIVTSKTNPGNSYKKNPKLEELYEYLFKEKMPNAHDALYDTLACLRCFVQLKTGIDCVEVL